MSVFYGPHWQTPYPAEKFADKGYVCQGLSHGTLECDENEKEAYRRFVGEVLRLELVSLPPQLPVFYLKDAFHPWYVVVVPQKIRNYLNENSRFTLRVSSASELQEAHKEFTKIGDDIRLTHLGQVREEKGRLYFLLGDPAKNWWEITAPQ